MGPNIIPEWGCISFQPLSVRNPPVLAPDVILFLLCALGAAHLQTHWNEWISSESPKKGLEGGVGQKTENSGCSSDSVLLLARQSFLRAPMCHSAPKNTVLKVINRLPKPIFSKINDKHRDKIIKPPAESKGLNRQRNVITFPLKNHPQPSNQFQNLLLPSLLSKPLLNAARH